jgi:hypothetical protein
MTVSATPDHDLQGLYRMGHAATVYTGIHALSRAAVAARP